LIIQNGEKTYFKIFPSKSFLKKPWIIGTKSLENKKTFILPLLFGMIGFIINSVDTTTLIIASIGILAWSYVFVKSLTKLISKSVRDDLKK
jgi:tetrahydromethanopterin S-methyltransferase subunit C